MIARILAKIARLFDDAPIENPPETKRNTRLFEDEVLYRLGLIDRRLGQIENDCSAIRAALVGVNTTQQEHLRAHADEAQRGHLRRVPTLSEEA